jgi:hypothetical protein
MLKNLKSFSFKTAAKQACETTVVHAAPRQHNLRDARRGAGENGSANKSGRDDCVEFCGNTRLVSSGTKVFK